MTALEVLANGMNAASIVLAARNNVQTWWTGIVGCVLFAAVFGQAKLYADATLQLFFVVTSIIGWQRWRSGGLSGGELPVTRASRRSLVIALVAAVVLTVGYALALSRFTDAAAPLPDSFVLAFSIAGQLLMMRRVVESWWFWLLVNTVAVPLYFSRGLYLTTALYVLFWVNAVVALRSWYRRVMQP